MTAPKPGSVEQLKIEEHLRDHHILTREQDDVLLAELTTLRADNERLTKEAEHHTKVFCETVAKLGQTETALLAAQAVNAKNGGIIAEQAAALERVGAGIDEMERHFDDGRPDLAHLSLVLFRGAKESR
jgi:hypothetical protein